MASDPVHERRGLVTLAQERGLSERRACVLANLQRSSGRYQARSRKNEISDEELLKRLEAHDPQQAH